MPFFTNPTSYRLNSIVDSPSNVPQSLVVLGFGDLLHAANDHSSHPAVGHLILLVFEAVLEVVAVSLPGYIVARQGMFNADNQKFVANLNVMLFTPCLSMYGLVSDSSTC